LPAALGLLVLVAVAPSAGPVLAQPLDAATSFLEGNDAYEAGRFADAAAAYRRCYEGGAKGADVLYNLGNAYAKQEQLGPALAAYTAARRSAPRDDDLLFNAERVAAQRAEQTPALPKGWLSSVALAFVDRHTLNELLVLALLALIATTVMATTALLRPRVSLRHALALASCAVVLVLAAASAWARYSQDYLHPHAFVAVASATMRSGPGEHFDVTGSLSDGAEVEQVGENGVWVDVRLTTGKRAWMRRSDLARL